MDSNTNENTTVKNVDKHKLMSMSLLSDKALLVVLSSNQLGKTFIIDKRVVLAGRALDCDIVLDDPMISKVHCKIFFDDDEKFYIEDVGSTNATFLNGKELKKKTHLIYGDRIILGNTILRFFLEEKIDGMG